MKRALLLIPLAASILVFTGCGTMRSGPKSEVGGPGLQPIKGDGFGKAAARAGFSTGPSDIVIVRAPSVQGVLPHKDIVPEDMAVIYRNALVEALNKSKAFGSVVKEEGAAPKQASSGIRTLYLDSSFVELDPGNRALRYFVGWGAGRVKVEVVSKVSDQQGVLLNGADRRVASFGIFGGSSKSFVVDSLSEIAEDHGAFFEDLRKKQAKQKI
jgi:hypothetical protein